MTATDPAPDPTSPGRRLRQELDARGWTQGDFAEILDRPVQFVSEVVTGKKEITRESATQFAAALGTSAEFWLTLQDAYHLGRLAQDPSTQRTSGGVRRRADLATKAAGLAVQLRRTELELRDLRALLNRTTAALNVALHYGGDQWTNCANPDQARAELDGCREALRLATEATASEDVR